MPESARAPSGPRRAGDALAAPPSPAQVVPASVSERKASALQPSERFENLDAVRSMACLLTLVSHVVFEYVTRHFPSSFLATSPVAAFVLGNGGLGVQIFFCLSGFLITHLLLVEHRDRGTIHLRNFYVRRVLRIWPVYFMVLSFVFVMYRAVKSMAGYDSPIHESWLSSVLFLANFDLIRILQDPVLYANGMLSLTWSVSVEEQFYLFWPLALLVAGTKRQPWLLALVPVGSFAFALIPGFSNELVYHHTLSNMMFLGAGGLLAYLRMHDAYVVRWMRGWSPRTWIAVGAACTTGLVWSKKPLLAVPGGLAAYMAFTALSVSALLAHQVIAVDRTRGLARAGWLVALAKYTYGLYMYHRIAGFVIATMVFKIARVTDTPLSGAVAVALNLLLAYGMSVASYRYVEAPLLTLKKHFEHARPSHGGT
jgi:peptidoglycan/LPS O-acetylase OafA/YrhL